MKEKIEKMTKEEIEKCERMVENKKDERGVERSTTIKKSTIKPILNSTEQTKQTKQEIEKEQEIEMVKRGLSEYLEYMKKQIKNDKIYLNSLDEIFNRFYTLKNNLKK